MFHTKCQRQRGFSLYLQFEIVDPYLLREFGMKLTKAKLAARKREEAKRRARAAQAEVQEPSPLALEMLVEVEPLPPEEVVKQEAAWGALEVVMNEEVKVEPLEPTEEGPDPIDAGQHPFVPLPELPGPNVKLENESETDQCQFCLSCFEDVGGRASVSRRKVLFVLGLRNRGRIREQNPECCQFCRQLFDQSFDFKKSCLAALAITEEVMASAERKDKYEIVDLKATLGMTPKTDATRSGDNFEDEAGKAGASAQTGGVSSMECSICKERFFEWSKLEQHWMSHYSVPVQEPNSTVSEPVPTKQQENKQKNIELYCFRCEKWFLTETIFTQHKPTCTGTKNTPQQTKPDKGSGDFYCFRCRKWFQTESLFANHKPSCIENEKKKCSAETNQLTPNAKRSQPAPKNQTKKCRRCRKTFDSEQLFTHHRALCKKTSTKKPVFPCPQCPKKFFTENNLTLHVNKHNGIRSVPCRREGCNKLFLNASVRTYHEQGCGQVVEASICSVCGATFRWPSNLQTHMKLHEEPKFACDQCPKKFHSKARLRKHSSVHSDARNYECKVCGKRFKSHEAHRVHQRIHTQEKPYICHICGMAFTYNCLLKTHLEKGHDSAVTAERKDPPVRPIATSSFQFPPSMWPTGGGY